MRIYLSKEEIYKDFAVALKFVLERPVLRRDYDELLKVLSRECRARLTEFEKTVKNFRTEYPLSVGFFVELPVEGDTGQEIGTRFVLLLHETGWEYFLALAGYVAGRVGEKVLDEAIEKISSFMKNSWRILLYGGVRIAHVEIRTENKGVMRIPFSDFEPHQVSCLLKKFDSIKHLKDCNDGCFQGKLVLPPESPKYPQARD